MIQKFIRIKNVGKFRDCRPAGEVDLRQLTLIYAENGRGKTTLCDVLRSLRTGEVDPVLGRATLGPQAPVEIEVRLDSRNAVFDSSGWSETLPDLRIFDSQFVHRNVYSGERVEHEQKRNLYRVIVGERGVELAQRVDELDAQIRAQDGLIKQARTPVAHLAPTSMSIDAFAILTEDPHIDRKIAVKEGELMAVRRSEEISSRPLLMSIDVPALPSTLPTVLAKGLEGISAEAENRVRGHLAAHTREASQAWLAQGIQFQHGDECPFCQQGVAGNELLEAYRGLFGEAYELLRREVEVLRRAVHAFDADAARVMLSQTVATNRDRLGFWGQFVTLEPLTLDLDELLDGMATLRGQALKAVDAKAAAVLESVTLGADFGTASLQFEAAGEAVRRYNAVVTSANARISEKKGQATTGELDRGEAELSHLKATKRRHEPDAVATTESYLAAVAEKRKLEQEKVAAKKELDEHSGDLLGVFQKQINLLLEMVTAGFRLTNITKEYKGRSPRSTYQVLINDVPVSLGDEKTPASQPSFRNTLSAGDRSTLALAFFLAQLELDPDLAKRVVVFDDPFTSQDLSRRTWTQQRIGRIAKRAKQVIVLSHEPSFLRLIHDAARSQSTRTLQFCRLGQEDTTITPYDITEATRGDYYKDHSVLTRFANDGDGEPRDVARTIRPTLEGYFRFKFPGEFGDTEWLGDFIGKLRTAAPGSALAQAPHKLLEELEDVNDYSKKYHHKQNPGADNEPITDGELKGYVETDAPGCGRLLEPLPFRESGDSGRTGARWRRSVG